jgi:pilus assembly protein CpaC
LFEPNDVRIPIFAEDAPFGPVIDEFMPNPLSIDDTGIFASLLTGNGLLNLTLDAAKEQGLAKILAEPTLTTLSGEEARFLSGGEFPIPVPQGLNGTTIEFKEFGVGLQFVPVVLGSGHVNLKLAISVSELTNASNVVLTTQDSTSTFLVPSLSKRSASATVELLDGQTMGIAGLISEDLRQAVNKFPGLGSIPILGNLFRSQQFIKGETELVILVTPRLARPMPKDRIRLPTDDFIEPNAKDFYLLGRMEGKRRETDDDAATQPAANNTGGVQSSFGQTIE